MALDSLIQILGLANLYMILLKSQQYKCTTIAECVIPRWHTAFLNYSSRDRSGERCIGKHIQPFTKEESQLCYMSRRAPTLKISYSCANELNRILQLYIAKQIAKVHVSWSNNRFSLGQGMCKTSWINLHNLSHQRGSIVQHFLDCYSRKICRKITNKSLSRTDQNLSIMDMGLQ